MLAEKIMQHETESPNRGAHSDVVRDDALQVRVGAIRDVAENIRCFELVDPDGGLLPRFTAGSHVDVHIAPALSRQYSLCNDPEEQHRYVIAVQREDSGRGGSRAMHELDVGRQLDISPPRNHFPLAERGARFHLLLAGGIGVTPMMAMIHELERREAPYLMHYCTRSPERTAFLDELAPRIEKGTVALHHDDGEAAKGLDIAATLNEYKVGTHLYACGPAGFLEAVNAAVKSWPQHVVHQEYFSAREMTEEEKAWDSKPFKIKLLGTGAVYDVPAGTSIAQVLQTNGCNVQTDCEEGYCGTCITRYVQGEPVHRDTVLDDNDREKYVMVCCARSREELLVLDL